MLDHRVVVGGVADDEVRAVDVVADQVVDDPAVLLAEHRVLRLAGLERAGIAHQRVTQEGHRLGSGDVDLAHVRQVEEAGRGTHRAVLLEDGSVLHRHLVAGERDEPPARSGVPVVERGARQGARLAHALASSCSRSERRVAASSRTERSVAWVSISSASSICTQRTSSNSWSWSSVRAADRPHQVEVDGLVEAGLAADEEVGDRVERLLHLDREAGLLARLAGRRLGERLTGVRRSLRERPQPGMAPMDEGYLGAAADGPMDDAPGTDRARVAKPRHAAATRGVRATVPCAGGAGRGDRPWGSGTGWSACAGRPPSPDRDGRERGRPCRFGASRGVDCSLRNGRAPRT